MRTHFAIHINQAAQGRITIGDSLAWFNALTATDQITAVYHVVAFLGQTDITPTHAELASLQSALATSGNLPVIVTADNFHYALRQLADGAAAPPADTYQLLLPVFARHDLTRRATQCANGCTHWWHHLH